MDEWLPLRVVAGLDEAGGRERQRSADDAAARKGGRTPCRPGRRSLRLRSPSRLPLVRALPFLVLLRHPLAGAPPPPAIRSPARAFSPPGRARAQGSDIRSAARAFSPPGRARAQGSDIRSAARAFSPPGRACAHGSVVARRRLGHPSCTDGAAVRSFCELCAARRRQRETADDLARALRVPESDEPDAHRAGGDRRPRHHAVSQRRDPRRSEARSGKRPRISSSRQRSVVPDSARRAPSSRWRRRRRHFKKSRRFRLRRARPGTKRRAPIRATRARPHRRRPRRPRVRSRRSSRPRRRSLKPLHVPPPRAPSPIRRTPSSSSRKARKRRRATSSIR